MPIRAFAAGELSGVPDPMPDHERFQRTHRWMTRWFSLLTVSLSGVVLLAATPLLALDPSASLTQYGLSSWMSDDGLPQSGVAAMAQTPDGYLWFGTEEGLARFDGVRFVTFFNRKSVSALLTSRDGSLWISVNGELARYKDRRMTHYTAHDGYRESSISSMSETADGSIWMATRTGLNRFHNGKFSAFSVTDGSANWIETTHVTRDGALWYGMNGGGLRRLYRGTETSFTTREGLADDTVLAIHEDRRGDLWIGTKGGLNRMRGGAITSLPVDGPASQTVHAIREDRDGNLWIGTEGGGLHRYSGGKLTSFATSHRLSQSPVISLLEDKEGSLWVGTSGRGLSQLRPGKFVTIGGSEGLNAHVWSVRESHDGSLLIGTTRGFVQWKAGIATHLTARGGLSSDTVRSVLEDRAGGIWLGTNDGVNLYKHGKVTVYGTEQGLPNNTVRTVKEDRRGDIWIGTRGGGLARYREGVFKVFDTTSGLASNVISSMAEDSDGSLWVGTTEGLSILKDGVFTNYTVKDGLSSNSVRSIYHDRQGGHWVGTYGSGLNRVKDGNITAIRRKDGLFDDIVYAIVEDRSGYLWMTCNRGIYRVSLRELNDFADGKVGRIHYRVFDAADGMKAAECNGGAPGAWEGKDGRLYFATIEGVATIDPNSIALNTLAPKVWIEEVLLDGSAANSSGNTLTVGPGEHDLEIHYTALSFISPARVRFRYRLKGFNDEWVDAGNRRTAFYTRLPPGKYTFEVMGSNNDGVWGNAGNPLQFHFRAAYFQTVWFKLMCGVALLLAMLTAFKIRLRLLRERERLLVSRVAEQTTELLAGKEHAEGVAESNALLKLKYELILNSIADGVYAVNLAGIITLENPAAARMLGWDAKEMVGRQAHMTTHHSRAGGRYPLQACPIYKTLADGVLRQVNDEVFWRKDGTSFPVDYLAAPILNARSEVTGVAVTFRDVTAQKAIDRLKSEFVSTVSHELRTPLTSIRGALGLLSSGVLGPIAGKGQRMLQIAVSNTDRLVRLINDILDLERIESGKVELALASVDANDLMLQVSESLQSIADHSGVRVVVVPAAASISGDSDRIIQTLTNLLGNAIKFSERDTTVTLSGTKRETDFVFSVADQGRGVPEEKLETIFERFSQVDGSDSRDKGGSGLGLAICQSIVHAHGGRIWVDKNEPAGSRFQFTIPLAGPAVPIVQPDLEPGPAGSVLLVEDDLDLARVMTAVLQNRGIATTHTVSGLEAIQRCHQVQPSVLVLDLVLPGMDGFAVVSALRESPSLARMPLLIYSAIDVGTADQARLRLGPTQFLTKSRSSLADFEDHIVRLVDAATKNAQNAA